MLKSTESFVPTNRESTNHHEDKLKKIKKSLKLKEIGMGEYHIELVLSLTSLLDSPHHYGRLSKAKRHFLLLPQTMYNGTLIKDPIPLKEEDENRAITTWIYREETLGDLT